MKRVCYAVVFLLLLISCTGTPAMNTETPAPLAAAFAASSSAPNTIRITGPFTLSRNDLFPFTNKQEYLSVVLMSGKYSEDWNPGPLMGRNWEGEFQLQLTDEDGKVISSADLNRFFKEGLVFNSFFDIDFDDYNGDGNVDFTIGQYASSNGNLFKLFTLEKSGKIEELPIKGHQELLVSAAERYSVKLTKTKTGFSSTYYDNRIEKHVKQSFVWNGKSFIGTS